MTTEERQAWQQALQYAFEELDKNGWDSKRDARTYAIEYKGKYYPNKQVLAYAEEYLEKRLPQYLDRGRLGGGKPINEYLASKGANAVLLNNGQESMIQQTYDNFVAKSNVETWEWYQDLRKYSEIMRTLKNRAAERKYNSYGDLNSDFQALAESPSDDFLERYLFKSYNGFSTIRQQLIRHDRRNAIREQVLSSYPVLNDILLEPYPKKCHGLVFKLVEQNCWSVIHRFLRALFPEHFTSVDALNHFAILRKKLRDIYQVAIDKADIFDGNEQALALIDFDDIYKAQIFFWMIKETNDYIPRTIAKEELRMAIPNIPLNQILFGPPGTGKTYNTINKALAIIEDKREADLFKESRGELLSRFEEYREKGQIVFTTFHQSMTYEDFIEGIKPYTTKDGKVNYHVEPGVFKETCIAAQTPNPIAFEEAYRRFQADLQSVGRLSLNTPRGMRYEVSLNSKGNLTLYTGEDKSYQGTLTKENLRRFINKDPAWKGWEGYFEGVVQHLTTNYKYTPIQTDDEVERYVLIIDEINRGNVSQIFGELITLIEESKREDGAEALTVTLPYSKKPFTVPSNLYIIGTMNTADRSVEALDAALRRRFSFTEMLPDTSLIRTHGQLNGQEGILDKGAEHPVDLVRLLETINLRIEKLVDRDHQIGHSYFLPVKDWETLRQAFYKCLIPLLQQYFFGDYGKIALVLGKGFVKDKGDEVKAGAGFFADVPEGYGDFVERKVYEIRTYTENEIEGFKTAVLGIKFMNGGN